MKDYEMIFEKKMTLYVLPKMEIMIRCKLGLQSNNRRKQYHVREAAVMIGCSWDQDVDANVGGAAWPGEAVGTACHSSGWAPAGCPEAAGSRPPPAWALHPSLMPPSCRGKARRRRWTVMGPAPTPQLPPSASLRRLTRPERVRGGEEALEVG